MLLMASWLLHNLAITQLDFHLESEWEAINSRQILDRSKLKLTIEYVNEGAGRDGIVCYAAIISRVTDGRLRYRELRISIVCRMRIESNLLFFYGLL